MKAKKKTRKKVSVTLDADKASRKPLQGIIETVRDASRRCSKRAGDLEELEQRVKRLSAVNDVERIRVSTREAILSTQGMIHTMPGFNIRWYFPSLNNTPRSQS